MDNTDRMGRAFRYRWIIFSILALAYVLVYFHRVSLSVVANDLIRDFQTTAGMLGLLGSIYFYFYAVLQFPAGLLSDSVGPRKTVTCFLLLACAGSVLFALAQNLPMAFLARILIGVGVSMVFIPTMKILSQWFRAHEFAMMAGLLQAAGGAGVLAATGALGWLAARLGWRLSFGLIGGGTLGIIALAWILVRDRPEDKGWPSIIDLDRKDHPANPPAQKIGLWTGARLVVAEKYFWPLAIWFFFDCGIFFGFGGLWAGPYLMDVYGMSRPQAGAILSMQAWGMILGGPALGLLSDKGFKSRKKVFLLCGGLLVLLFLVLTGFRLPAAGLAGWFFLFSVCCSAIVTIAFTSTKELFPVQIAGTSVGTMNLFPFLGGAVFMPLLGRILDYYPKAESQGYSPAGYRIVLWVLLGASLVSLLCTFWMKETFRSSRGS
jgi:sugar phosphate permease